MRASDIVLEGETPGLLAELGLEYEAFEPQHPELVWVSITPFGRSSPRGHGSRTPISRWRRARDRRGVAATTTTGSRPCAPAATRCSTQRAFGPSRRHWSPCTSAQTRGFGQLVDVSMYAASNVTTEAATYEWLVAEATVQRYTFRHAAVRPTPPRMMPSADGKTVIGALPRRAGEFGALKEWMVDLGLDSQFDEFFFLEWGVERGGVQIPDVASDPEVAAIYQAGSNGLRFVAAHLPGMTFFLEAQQRGIPAAVLYAPEDVITDEHFVSRGFPVEIHHEDLGRSFVYPGAAFRAPASPWRVARTGAPHRRTRRKGVGGEHDGDGQKFETRVLVSGLGCRTRVAISVEMVSTWRWTPR